MNIFKAPQIEAQYPLQGIVKGHIISSEDLYSPGSELTLKAIERVSKPSSPETIEPLQNDQNPRMLIRISHPRPKGRGFQVFCKRRLADKVGKSALRHRIRQWSVAKLVEVLNNKLLLVAEVSETYSPSLDPFKDKPVPGYISSVVCYAVIGGKMLGVLKIQLRLAELSNEMILDRDFIGGINIGLRFHLDGRPVALVSTGPYGSW
jgi:hypothetical protein